MEMIPGVTTFSTDGASSSEIVFDQVFDSGVRAATALLQGMDVQFRPRSDHELGRLVVQLATDITGGQTNHVTVTAKFLLRDWSGGDDAENGDDPIEGTIWWTVLVDV